VICVQWIGFRDLQVKVMEVCELVIACCIVEETELGVSPTSFNSARRSIKDEG